MDSKDSKFRSCNSANSLIPIILGLEVSGRFIGWIKILAINWWKELSKIWDAGREDCFCSEQDHPEFPIPEEGQSRGTESPERGSVSTRKTDRLDDQRQLSSDWRSWYSIGYADLFSVSLHDDNIQEFDTRWDEVLLSMTKTPSGDILESLYKLRIREPATVLELNDMEIHQKIEDNGEEEYRSETSISNLWRKARENWNRSSDQESNGNEWRWRRKGICYQCKEIGQCSKGDQCSFRHGSNDRAQKPDHNAATPSKPSFSWGRSVSRTRSVRGKSNPGMILRQPCRYYLKSTCTLSPCEYLHPPECQFYKTETGCKAGDECLFPHHKVDEQPNKKPKKKNDHSHKGRESKDKNAVAVVKTVPQLGCVARLGSIGFPKRKTALGKPDAKSLGTDPKSTVHSVYATSSKYPGKERTIARKNTSQKSLSAKSLRNLRTGPMKRLKDNSDVPEARLGILPKIFTSSKRTTKTTFYSPSEEWYSWLRQQKRRRKESLWWIPELLCTWSARKTFTLLSWRPWGHRGVRRRRWRPTARCKQEKKQQYTSKNWTYSWRWCFLKKPPQFSLGKLCEDRGFTYHWTSGQKPHLTKKGKKIHFNISNYVPFVVPGLSTSSSTTPTPTSSTSSSQDSVFDVSRYTENPVLERSGSMSDDLRWNPLHKPTETENRNKDEGREEVQSDLLHDLPDWLQEFRENLVDESVPTESRRNPSHENRDTSSSSHELPMESRRKVERGSGKHSIYTHFPKDPNCDICLKTKITGASCRRRAGTVVPRAENLVTW